MTVVSDCPCGRTDARGRVLAYRDCCQPWHEGRPAPDAQALMRSRYSAFVRQDAAYLLATWHTSTRPATVDFEPGLRWLGLEVRDHRVANEGHAEVEFVARSRLAGRGQRLHERSRFVHEQGRWFYLDGDIR
jgi:SEC-C motif-containing protein